MSAPIEDYALLSDLHTGPLVSRHGSIDWLCLPRFDSPAVFTALVGTPDDGHWQLCVANAEPEQRRYVGHSLVLETTWRGESGVVRVTDFMPPSSDHADLVRHVECLEGEVEVRHDLVLGFDYARRKPWSRITEHNGERVWRFVAGEDALNLHGPLLEASDDEACIGDLDAGGPMRHLAGSFALAAGESACWTLTWARSYDPMPDPVAVEAARAETVEFWEGWIREATAHDDDHPYAEAVARSLVVLRGLTHSRTGGLVAAPTASLPEHFGGERNWDYRFTWLRDAAFTIEALLDHGETDSAELWRQWLIRAIAGDAEDVRIMYGLSGERHLPEEELDHLSGYENSRPVRIGNGAADQYQSDVVGEVMLALAKLRRADKESDPSWAMQKNLVAFLLDNFDRKDHGIWEMRGDLHHFTHGRVMMWAALNCAIEAVEEYDLPGDVDLWRERRAALHDEIWERGFDRELNSFTQTYENNEVDASLLQLPHAGFVAYDDPAMLGTVARIESDLASDAGFVHRYRTGAGLDGLEGDEYAFIMCTLWLVEQYACSGRREDAKAIMDRVLGVANDLGLLAEEYDEEGGRLAGNFPQAFSHLALIRAGDALDGRSDPL
ncbi:glycoside hydrolase family 15 protein [Propioniciclava soli]|uniref:Glycoside hydrolase family 15 protein n=1 Tax=Propioniciclava soli TaxID=2775081 RepID=A0ABZ3CA24_9ACTN